MLPFLKSFENFNIFFLNASYPPPFAVSNSLTYQFYQKIKVSGYFKKINKNYKFKYGYKSWWFLTICSDSGAFAGAGAGAVRNVYCIIIWLTPNHFLKSFCVTPPSKCRMPAKLTFLVIYKKSIYKLIPKVGDTHWF